LKKSKGRVNVWPSSCTVNFRDIGILPDTNGKGGRGNGRETEKKALPVQTGKKETLKTCLVETGENLSERKQNNTNKTKRDIDSSSIKSAVVRGTFGKGNCNWKRTRRANV